MSSENIQNKPISTLGTDYSNLSTVGDFRKYIAQVNKIPSLTQEEEFLLAKAYLEEQDPDAAKKLVASHLKLVVKIAIGYKNYGLPTSDLVSEGNIGLIQAVKKYNPDLGFRLSTYAMWWIKASVQDYILRSWSLVKIGTRAAQKKLFFGLTRAKNNISRIHERDVNYNDFEDIARKMDVKVEDVAEMNMRLGASDLSLNSPASSSAEDSQAEMMEFLPETRQDHETSLLEREENSWRSVIVKDAIRSLNPREQNILISRRLKTPVVTLDTLSNKYNISRERVRQIENRAFEKIQQFVTDKIDSSNNYQIGL